jgi:hypothetical protein
MAETDRRVSPSRSALRTPRRRRRNGSGNPFSPVFPLNHAAARQSRASLTALVSTIPLVTERTKHAGERRCRGTSRSGERCRAHVVNAAGYCVAHDPEKPMYMRELGRKSGEARRRGVARELPQEARQSLRTILREQLEPEKVKAAIEQSLAGGNESARVAAVKFLADLELYRRDGDECPTCAAMKAEAPQAWAKVERLLEKYIEAIVRQESSGATGFTDSQGVMHDRGGDSQVMAMIRRAVRRAREGHEKDLEAAVGEMIGKIIDGLAVPGDVTSERAGRILHVLEEQGLLVPRGRVEALAEELAQERLKALKSEHGIPT